MTNVTQVASSSARSGHVSLQRKCACNGKTSLGNECEECKKRRRKEDSVLHRSATSSSHAGEVAPPIVHQALRSESQPLDAGARSFLESRFNHDFSRVRIHTDQTAAESAASVDAAAYTVGSHIVFAKGEYAPKSSQGLRLVAHELTHVVQQGDSSPNGLIRMQPAGTSAEAEAEAAADHSMLLVRSGLPFVTPHARQPQLQRQLKHDPSGPYHPPEGKKLRCTELDDCAALSEKIAYLAHTIESHEKWDAANPQPDYPKGRHGDKEIPDLETALENCKALHTTKCTNQPQWLPVFSTAEVGELLDKITSGTNDAIKSATEQIQRDKERIAIAIGVTVVVVAAAALALAAIGAGVALTVALAEAGIDVATFGAVLASVVSRTAAKGGF